MMDIISLSYHYWIVAVVVAVFGLWFFILRPRQGGPKAPPMVLSLASSPLIPSFIGVIMEFAASPIKMVRRCYDDYGPVFTVPILHKRLTFLVGPEAQEIFFRASDDVLSQNEVYDFMKPVFGPNVVYDASRKDRQVQFQSMANGLRTARLKSYVGKIETETRTFLKHHWGNTDDGEVDLLVTLSELTILTASRCLHGDDVREHMFKELYRLYHDLDHGLTPLTVFMPNLPTKAHLRRNAARQEMCALFTKVIKERRDHPDRSDGTDILSIFMDLKYKDGRSITEEEVTGLLIALLFAGQHTSCISSTWTLLFILNNPSILGRVLSEQETVLSSSKFKTSESAESSVESESPQSSSLTYDDLNQMELLHNCMKEALRLCPPLVLLIRKAMKDIPVSIKSTGASYVIPKDDMVFVSPSVGMRLPAVFANPDTFDPDRFSEDRQEDKRTPYSYLGFGGGMHSCMGQNFGYMQVKTILSVILQEYELEMVSPTMPDIDYEAMVVGPKGDCRVRYKKRRSSRSGVPTNATTTSSS